MVHSSWFIAGMQRYTLKTILKVVKGINNELKDLWFIVGMQRYALKTIPKVVKAMNYDP
jgi:hypothetical protein